MLKILKLVTLKLKVKVPKGNFKNRLLDFKAFSAQ